MCRRTKNLCHAKFPLIPNLSNSSLYSNDYNKLWGLITSMLVAFILKYLKWWVGQHWIRSEIMLDHTETFKNIQERFDSRVIIILTLPILNIIQKDYFRCLSYFSMIISTKSSLTIPSDWSADEHFWLVRRWASLIGRHNMRHLTDQPFRFQFQVLI